MIIQGVTLTGVTVVDAQIVINGLTYYIDAGNSSSYSGSGSTINNIAGTAPGAATLTNTPTFTSAGLASYFTFNGSTQYIMTSNLIGQSMTGNVTLECWVNTSSDNGVVVSEQGQTPPNSNWYDSQVELVSGNLKVAMWPYTIGNPSVGVVVGAVTRNTWQQYTMVYSAGTCRGYINGSTTASYSVTRSFGGAGLYYDIMGPCPTSLGDGTGLAGNWSIFRAYNRALSATEVLQNYNATRGRYGV
jgi:hypothetical protein